MLSYRLIELIESHWEQIAASTIAEIRHDEKLPHMRELPESDLRAWAQGILKNLPSWPAPDYEIAKRYERLGQQRFREAVPLHEAIRSLHHLKRKLIDFTREQGYPQTSVELYAEEELQRRVSLFFDHLLYHVARGYEEAQHSATLAAG
jgi:hypothetical protein